MPNLCVVAVHADPLLLAFEGGVRCRCGNQEIYRRLRLIPRVMRNVADVSTETLMLGQKISFPVYISAAAKGGLAHADAEEALCRAAYAKKTIQMCPHMATKTLEQVMIFPMLRTWGSFPQVSVWPWSLVPQVFRVFLCADGICQSCRSDSVPSAVC